MALHVETIEPVAEPRGTTTVALAHGFTQNARCWGDFGMALANETGPVLAVDLPGHGRSAHDDADLPTAAKLTVEAIDSAGGAATWIGYSMGGRVLLHAALKASATIERLVLIGATPGLRDPADRADRRAADARLADRLMADGLESFLDFWLDLPLFAALDDDASGRSHQEPLWDRLGELSMPVLIIAGERDDKFRAIGEAMAAAIGANARFAVIEGAGHACHLENPAATVAAILNR